MDKFTSDHICNDICIALGLGRLGSDTSSNLVTPEVRRSTRIQSKGSELVNLERSDTNIPHARPFSVSFLLLLINAVLTIPSQSAPPKQFLHKIPSKNPSRGEIVKALRSQHDLFQKDATELYKEITGSSEFFVFRNQAACTNEFFSNR